MISGIHHISMRCETKEEYVEVKHFYTEVLGLQIRREWADGMMIDTGNSLIEVFPTGGGEHAQGVIKHFALATDNVDEIVDKVKAAGYKVFIEPNDRVIKSSPEFPFRMAFCYGPLGEEIEFFCEK